MASWFNLPPPAGTWKARLEAMMASVPADAPAPAPWVTGRERVIIHLDMVSSSQPSLEGTRHYSPRP